MGHVIARNWRTVAWLCLQCQSGHNVKIRKILLGSLIRVDPHLALLVISNDSRIVSLFFLQVQQTFPVLKLVKICMYAPNDFRTLAGSLQVPTFMTFFESILFEVFLTTRLISLGWGLLRTMVQMKFQLPCYILKSHISVNGC